VVSGQSAQEICWDRGRPARNEREARTTLSPAIKPAQPSGLPLTTGPWPLLDWHQTAHRSIFTRSIQWSEPQTSTQQTSRSALACICVVVSAIDRADSIVWLRL